MRYVLIDEAFCSIDDTIDAYENCEECPYFLDCYEIEEEK